LKKKHYNTNNYLPHYQLQNVVLFHKYSNADLFDKGSAVECGEWRLFCRLDDDHVASSQSWGDLPCKHAHWVVPLANNHNRYDLDTQGVVHT
jgi:hypothetical protein